MKKTIYILFITPLFFSIVKAQTTVTATNNVFTPADVTINLGETVEWINSEGNHNANGSLASFPSNPEGFTSGDPSSDPWTFSHTFNTLGIYDYRCDLHFSVGMTGTVTVQMPNSVVDPSIADKVKFFPNPATDALFIESDLKVDRIQILNVLGLQLMNIDEPQATEKVSIGELSSGVYMISFIVDDRIWSAKFIKQ